MNTLTRFDLNLLLALESLLAERHVTRAAERLYVSQPTMSGMLQRLREQFDDPLLIRVGREMELTPKAVALSAPLQEALRTVRGLMAAEPSFEPATSHRSFKIVMSDYCAFVFLPAVMERLSTLAPGIQIQIEPLTPTVYEQLENGELELCLTTDDWRLLGAMRQSESLNSVPLFTDRHVSILSTQSAPSGELTIEEFGSRSHAIMRFGRNTMSIEEAALRRSGFEFEPRVITSSFSALLGVVATTSMVATVPERLTSILAGRLGLKAYNPPIEIPDLTEAMTWHTRHDFDPAHAWLRGLFIDCGREL